MSAQENINQITKFFFTLKLLNRLYHWNTTSFARHKATDGFDDDLDSTMDKFLEVYIGRYNVKPQLTSIKLDQMLITDIGIETLFLQSKTYLESFEGLFNDKDLLNLRDELLANVNKTLYLFQLK